MIRLIANENMKIYRRSRTWVLIALQLLTIIVPLFFIQKADDNGWQAALVAEIQASEQELVEDARYLDDRTVQAIKNEIQINNYRLEHDIPPIGSLWSVVSEWLFILQIATLFVVIIASDIVASEYTWGTMKLLLIRPASRMKVLFAKYASVLMFAVLLVSLCFVGAFIIGAAFYGLGGAGDVYLSVKDGQVQESSMGLHVLGTYLLGSVRLLMITTFAFMISAVFRSGSLAIALSMLFLFVGESLTMLLSKYEWAKYILFANTDLTPYLDGNAPMPGMTLGFSIAVLIVYYILFHLTSVLVFKKRDVRI